MLAISEHRVVEQIRQRGEGPVQPALAVTPPVSVLDNQPEILRAGLANPRICEEQPLVVEYESGGEGIRIGRQSERAKRRGRQKILTVSTGPHRVRDVPPCTRNRDHPPGKSEIFRGQYG